MKQRDIIYKFKFIAGIISYQCGFIPGKKLLSGQIINFHKPKVRLYWNNSRFQASVAVTSLFKFTQIIGEFNHYSPDINTLQFPKLSDQFCMICPTIHFSPIYAQYMTHLSIDTQLRNLFELYVITHYSVIFRLYIIAILAVANIITPFS